MNLAYDVVVYPMFGKQQNLPPVLMLHGILDSRKTWKRIAPQISLITGRVVYAVDARNHGNSPWSNEMTWDALVDDVGDFLSQHGIPKAIIVGHSMGGRTALTFALKKPEMVEKLIVEDVGVKPIRAQDGFLTVEVLKFLKEFLTFFPRGVDERTVKRAFARDYMSRFFPSVDEDYVPLVKDGDTIRWLANMDVLEKFTASQALTHDVSDLGIFNGDAMFLYGSKSVYKVKIHSLMST